VFLDIKRFLKQLAVNKKQQGFKKSSRKRKRTDASIFNNAHSVYEPTNINYAYNSDFWRWRKVIEWGKYINDPMNKVKKIRIQREIIYLNSLRTL